MRCLLPFALLLCATMTATAEEYSSQELRQAELIRDAAMVRATLAIDALNKEWDFDKEEWRACFAQNKANRWAAYACLLDLLPVESAPGFRGFKAGSRTLTARIREQIGRAEATDAHTQCASAHPTSEDWEAMDECMRDMARSLGVPIDQRATRSDAHSAASTDCAHGDSISPIRQETVVRFASAHAFNVLKEGSCPRAQAFRNASRALAGSSPSRASRRLSMSVALRFMAEMNRTTVQKVKDNNPDCSRTFVRYAVVRMTAAEIILRVNGLAGELPPKTRDALRKAAEREGSLPTLRTLADAAAAKQTSIAYLIGETDDPASAPPPRKSAGPLTLIALEANATPTFPAQAHPTVLVSLQTTTHGEVGVLLPPREASWLADRMKDAAKQIADHETARSSPPSASTS